MTNKPKMRVLRSGDPYGCAGGTCPTVYEAADGSIYVQGYVTDDAERAQITLPPGEALVRISRELWDSLAKG